MDSFIDNGLNLQIPFMNYIHKLYKYQLCTWCTLLKLIESVNRYINDKAADFCERKQILPKKKENYTHCPFILIVYVMFMFYMLHSKWYWYIVHVHDSFYLVVTLVQKPQQWQTQNVIKLTRRQKKWFICVKHQWPWLKVGHSDRCHIFALSIEILEYNGNYFVFNDCLMWLLVLIIIIYDLWNMHMQLFYSIFLVYG